MSWTDIHRGDGPTLVVERIQQRLLALGYSLGSAGVDGKFGSMTEGAVEAFQRTHQLPPTGSVDEATFAALAVVDDDAGNWAFSLQDFCMATEGAPRPPFLPLVGNEQRSQVFGRFNYLPASTRDNPEGIKILGDWTTRQLATVHVPQLTTIPGFEYRGQQVGKGPTSGHVWAHRLIADQLVALWASWETAGLLDRVITWGGLWSPRFIRGSSTVLSNHAYATAFDVNAPWNALGATPAACGERGSVVELVELAHEHGFFWGGHFSRKDGMHFEVAKVL